MRKREARIVFLVLSIVMACVSCAAVPTRNRVAAVVSPNQLTFASQVLGTTSPAQAFTVTNAGNRNLGISGISITGDYAESTNCGRTLAAGATCTISVTFTPTATGTRSGSLSLSSSIAVQKFSLTGVGGTAQAATPSPSDSLSATSLTFATQTVGAVSAAQPITVTNTGTVTISISGVSASGDFLQSNNCGSSLAAGTQCTVSVTFKPSATGLRTGILSITDSASASAQTVSLSGTGATTGDSLSATSLTFGSQTVGTASSAQTVSLSNTGTGAISISGLSASGDFLQSNNCGSSLAAGTQCTISVTFKPTVAGTRTGLLSITDSASASAQTVSLSGTGATTADSLSATSLTFGSQTVNTTSASQTVALTNTGSTSITINSIGISSSFVQSNNCVTSLAPSATCKIVVQFDPTTTGAISGTLTITNSAASSPQTVALTGTGIAATHTVSIAWSPSSSTGVIGYNIYRSTVSGSYYAKLNPSTDGATSYSDNTVTSGTTYYYVTTAVNSSGEESAYSNQATAVVP